MIKTTAIAGEPAPVQTGTVCQICDRFIPAPMMRADRWICKECSSRLKKMIYPDSDPALCTQDEIQHVGYDEAQCGREK